MPPIPSSLSIWRATSYSRNLRTYFALPARSWRVFSTHTHACNLLSDEDEWIALVDQQHGNGPFHVVIPAAILRQREENESVHYADNFLYFSEASLDLRSAELWEPHLAPVTLHSHTLLWLHEKIRVIDSPLFASTPSVRQTLPTLATPLIERLCQGLQQGEQAQIIQAAQQLAGLGPGLTPAGDDFLLGLMAAFTLSEPTLGQNLSRAAACTLIGNAAAQRTTRLSGQWLQAAGRGEFGAAWHQLANALEKADQAPIEQAIARILASGATSGADALRGFGMGLTLNTV